MTPTKQHWLAVGRRENWITALTQRRIWGLKTTQRRLWEGINTGFDVVLFYVTSPVCGVVGYGPIVGLMEENTLEWNEEKATRDAIWPLRFEFQVNCCLPPRSWEGLRAVTPELLKRVRSGFQRLWPDVAEGIMRELDGRDVGTSEHQTC